MRKLLMIGLMMLSGVLVYAQKKKEKMPVELPPVVQKAFEQRFPEAAEVKWKKKKDKDRYEAKFIQKDSKYQALFQGDGIWLKTEKRLKVGELPEKAGSYINTRFSGYEITRVELDIREHATRYEVKIKKRDTKHELWFDKEGDFIKKKK